MTQGTRGLQQVVRYEGSAERLVYVVTDDYGRQQAPDEFPLLVIYDTGGTERVSAGSVKGEIDFGAAGCTNLDSVIEGFQEGDWANDWTATVETDSSYAVTLDHSAKTITITYVDGVTTVANIVTAFAGLRGTDDIFEVQSAGTGANVLSSPGDDLAATNLTLGTGAAMIPVISSVDGFLAYDAQTAEFTVGQLLTGGTSTATALIVGQRKTGASGVLELADVAGTFQNNETIIDGLSGSATSDLLLFQAEHFYELDASGTTVYGVAKNYQGKVTYDIDSRSYTRYFYFDVAFSPATAPWVTHADVIREYPGLIGAAPEEWGDFTPSIKKAHRKLVNKIHALGDQAAFYVKRAEEMWGIEMAYVRQAIAEALGEDQEKIDYWANEASEAWASRGEFTYDSDDDSEVDEGVKVISSGFTR